MPKLGDVGQEVRAVQEKLFARGETVTIDGHYGPATAAAVAHFQQNNGLMVDGMAGPKTIAALSGYVGKPVLTEDLFKTAAAELDLPLNVLKAFASVESPGSGFLPSGRATILFERHKMRYYIAQYVGSSSAEAWQKKRPDIVNNQRGGYVGKDAEYIRLAAAKQINVRAAIESASWGQFQIMGENWQALGYTSAEDFEQRMQTSEAEQFEAFIRFVKSKPKLLPALRDQKWDTVFKLYNGPAYKDQAYDLKFLAALRRFDGLSGAAA